MVDIVVVKNLKKIYGSFTAVNDISFTIGQGEVFGFLGPNGAGKTSTINMLIGLSHISSGSVTIGGIDCVKNMKKAQRLMGIVPDESNLYDDMDGFDNLCFCGSLYGMRKKEREIRARELLKEFNLLDAGKKHFKAYSKGMRRKLCIAAGIMHNPQILFLDEPTTGIDVESARQIRSLILALKKSGTTVFITTHYIEDAQRICDRIAFIVQGEIVKTGAVEELMANAADDFAMQIKHSGKIDGFVAEFNDTFLGSKIEVRNENECLLRSCQKINLAQVVQFFDDKGLAVYEAKQLHPTLEDVFVKITGIEAAKLKKEKEGKK